VDMQQKPTVTPVQVARPEVKPAPHPAPPPGPGGQRLVSA
jgi:hypothetical protein